MELPKFQPPYLIKPRRSNQGRGILFAKDLKSLEEILITLKNKEDYNYVIQSLLPKESEYRILCLNGKIIGALKKNVERKIIANASGVSCEYISEKEIPEKMLNIVNKFLTKTNLFFVGLDIMTVKNQPILIEANLTPGFKEFEKYSQKNIARLYLEQVIEQTSR